MTVEHRHHLRDGSGLGAAVASAAAFGTSGTFATSLLKSGWTPGAAVTARLLIAALALSLPALRQLRSHPGAIRTGWRTLLLYGVIPVAGCQLCYFEAVQHLSVAVALLLEYSGTVLVVSWMWARHHQSPTRTTAAGAVAAVAGLVLVLDLAGEHHLDPVGVLWGLGAAVGLAAYFLLSARTPDGGTPPLIVAWGGLTVGAVTAGAIGLTGILPLHDSHRDVVLAGAHTSWLVPLLGVGLVAAAFAYVTGIAAARALGPRLASFVGLAEVLFAALYAWVLLGQRLGATQLVGGALVVAGITLVRLGEPDRGPDGRPATSGAGPEEMAGIEVLAAA